MFRRFLIFVMVLILCGMIVTPKTTYAMNSDGDVAPFGDRDGIVNVGDALVCLRFALGLETPTDEDRLHADVAPLGSDGQPDPDGVINVGDALVILRKAVGLVSFDGIVDPGDIYGGESNLPDTGQTICFNTPGNSIDCTDTGQDGEYLINPPSYTDNDNGTVTDNVTALIWQQEDDNQTRAWQQAIDYCSSYSPDGSVWRLPSISELQAIVDLGTSSPTINAVFTDTESSGYWSSTSNASYPSYSWFVYFSSSFIYSGSKSDNYYTRCVR